MFDLYPEEVRGWPEERCRTCGAEMPVRVVGIALGWMRWRSSLCQACGFDGLELPGGSLWLH